MLKRKLCMRPVLLASAFRLKDHHEISSDRGCSNKALRLQIVGEGLVE